MTPRAMRRVLIKKSTCSVTYVWMCVTGRQQRLTDAGNTSGMRKIHFQQRQKHEALMIFFPLLWVSFSSDPLIFLSLLLSCSRSSNVSGLSISVISVPTSQTGPALGFGEVFLSAGRQVSCSLFSIPQTHPKKSTIFHLRALWTLYPVATLIP